MFDTWIGHIIGLIAILILCLPTVFLDKIMARFSAHQAIRESDLRSVHLHAGGQERALTLEERQHVRELYNKASFISKRSPQPDAEPRLLFSLASGENVRVQLLGNDLEVVRNRTNHRSPIVFWARQADLSAWLAAAGVVTQGGEGQV